ncbi:MAG: UDP-N-acetylmuramate--L-alanine ligase [Sandaracinaceae bacterium]|nr:UDP-N-acetylmuramate--L-alanine ligase [Sandaracinaceae bacterium]MBK7772880.1 UDP-N-acetylmuramate--L-alanine ligase [Sandaracinaceae bacterium]MBK8407090.1 UDP-N-acetylmuramate--L-alanine ligase [Sandaracinaceae bacterium]MBK8588833.1 UDP-N-acetylmuramate--L-alanine ligase [Sandaracinaceae bacterium]MBP7681950.1 UDP-N-acetylmuramate--L-alanine ligase [Deltaproteobacteria bacterium]
MFRGKIRSIHFIGIGGVGMSGIAEVLLDYGFEVTGSDLRMNDYASRLVDKGAKVALGHAAENVASADVVVFSSAVSPKNPEIVEARLRGVPVIPRAEMLGELMRLKDGIAIAGSHGKTTTTSLVATVLRDAGLDPTVVIGGKLNALGSGAASGAGDLLVAEADESDGSFLHLTPGIAVITNIDPEHLDHYGTLEAVKEAFIGFANRVPFYGLVVACLDHPNVQDILPSIDKRIVTYGLAAQADYRARNPKFSGLAMTFSVFRRGEALGDFEVRMPGIHNVLNALATIAVADELGVPHDKLREALRTFGGVQRRFTIVGEHEGVTIVDDYGHHPAEVQVTLDAAQRAYGRRLVVAFQPHRYTRTRDCFLDLTRCFNRADVLFLTDVYAAGEEPIRGADSAALVDAIRAHGHRDVTLINDRKDLVAAMRARIRPGDVVLTLGAGDITKTGRELLADMTTAP